MLRWALMRAWFDPLVLGLLCCGTLQCAGYSDTGERSRSSRSPLRGGSLVDAADTPVLFLRNPQGSCSATAVAPRLAVTARHCVAHMLSQSFACTATGELILDGTGAGEIGVDYAPETLAFFTSAHLSAAFEPNGVPDAVGAKILSTNTESACRDDLAFIVLDRDLPGLAFAPMRLDDSTRIDENTSVLGYGLAEELGPTALRIRSGVRILAIGPNLPTVDMELAPVRALEIDAVTCLGDSGGPVMSEITGEILGVVSTGIEYDPSPFCEQSPLASTFAVRVGAYGDLARLALTSAGMGGLPEAGIADSASLAETQVDLDASPSTFDTVPSDSEGLDSSNAEAALSPDVEDQTSDGAGAVEPPAPSAGDAGRPLGTSTGGLTAGCSFAPPSHHTSEHGYIMASSLLALMMIARKRRL